MQREAGAGVGPGEVECGKPRHRMVEGLEVQPQCALLEEGQQKQCPQR